MLQFTVNNMAKVSCPTVSSSISSNSSSTSKVFSNTASKGSSSNSSSKGYSLKDIASTTSTDSSMDEREEGNKQTDSAVDLSSEKKKVGTKKHSSRKLDIFGLDKDDKEVISRLGVYSYHSEFDKPSTTMSTKPRVTTITNYSHQENTNYGNQENPTCSELGVITASSPIFVHSTKHFILLESSSPSTQDILQLNIFPTYSAPASALSSPLNVQDDLLGASPVLDSLACLDYPPPDLVFSNPLSTCAIESITTTTTTRSFAAEKKSKRSSFSQSIKKVFSLALFRSRRT